MAGSVFSVDPEIQCTTIDIDSWPLCEVLLSTDANYPGWLVLVPRRHGASEIIDLNEADQVTLMHEISLASKLVQKICAPDKLNVGALGNVVKQLHIHIVPRFYTDLAWPKPMWGSSPSQKFKNDELQLLVSRFKSTIMQMDVHSSEQCTESNEK